MSTANHCDVAIVGLGPVGATLAALLGQRGIKVVAVDAALTPTPYPRAIAADDEMLRTMLTLPGIRGIGDPGQLFEPAGKVEIRDARERLLTQVSFPESALGVAGLSFFHQPSLEARLREGLADLPSVRVELGAAVTGLVDQPGGVGLEIEGARALHASWVVGCDGAASAVRRARGISYAGRTFAEPWIVVDIDSPSPLPHLPNFTYVLDPRRPSVNMPRPGGHRFEFMVRPGEDPQEMAGQAQVERWLEPYLGALTPSLRAGLRVVRAAVYTFHARTAGRWRDGRVLLAGDAAHCMPPFGGQGLGAGIGDALALAWRLDEVIHELAPPRLLDDYERDRRPRIGEMTRTALIAGRLLTASSPPAAAAARLALKTIDATPLLGTRFRAGALRAQPRISTPGRRPLTHAGKPLPNPRVGTGDGRLLRLDEVLPEGWSLIGNGVNPVDGLPQRLLAALSLRSCATLAISPPQGFAALVRLGCPAVADLDGSLLALWGRRETGILLVRPDRFIVALSQGTALAAEFDRLTRADSAPR